MQFGRRKLNANGRTVFANEEPESVMIFEWLKPFTQSKIFQPTSFFGESNGSVGLATTRMFQATPCATFFSISRSKPARNWACAVGAKNAGYLSCLPMPI